MSIDLQINNYSFLELLNLFKIKRISHISSNIEKIKSHISVIKDQCSNEIYVFYYKASNIIIIINKLLGYDGVQEEDIPTYLNKIRQIKSFEKYEMQAIINIIYSTPSPTNKPANTESNIQINSIIDTFTNSIAPGNLNSIKRITQFQNLNLNTCFRSNYFSSSSCNFQYVIPSEIKNVVSMRLASIEIPNAWYLFSHIKKNNVFKIVVEGVTYTINIPDGNYDSESLQYFLNTTYFCDSDSDNCLQYIRFSIDIRTFKSQFEIIDNNDHSCKPCQLKFSLLFDEDANANCMNRFGWTIGFRYPQYCNIDKNIQSEGLFDGAGDRYIYMSLTDYQYNNNGTNIIGFDKSSMDEDILAKIPMTNGKLSLIIDEGNPLTKTRKYNGPVNINKLQIKILDKFGEVIDLNNMDFSFTLELEILYESFNFKNING